MSFLIGVDGGGTRTTVVLADPAGRELLRRVGPAGLVDPRAPVATAGVLGSVIRQAVREAGLRGPAAALCAGLAGVGNPPEAEAVRAALAASDLAERVLVVSDGEIALEGAFRGGPGILLIAGTGSLAYGRGEDGRVERCGGWGMVVGDEGSGYAIGRAALGAALAGLDGRGPETRLLDVLLDHLGLQDPRGIPPWAGRAAKAEIAALTPLVRRVASAGDPVATSLLRGAAYELARHVHALAARLAPWSGPPAVVFFGGALRDPGFAELVSREIRDPGLAGLQPRPPAEDAVTGALRIAAKLSTAEPSRP